MILDKYFKDSIEYAMAPVNEVLAGDILEFGVLYEYVGNTFLNGFINSVKIIKAYVLDRYCPWDESFDEPHELTIQDPPNSFTWVKKSFINKTEVFNCLTEKGRMFSGDLDYNFQDDVVIIGRVGDTNVYMLFYYDRDCSDCMIGRFKTDDNADEMQIEINKMLSWFKKNAGNGDEKEIPLHYFNGWVSG